MTAEDLHDAILAGELHFLDSLALDLFLGSEKVLVLQRGELLLELECFSIP
jgi:hypothetical protein